MADQDPFAALGAVPAPPPTAQQSTPVQTSQPDEQDPFAALGATPAPAPAQPGIAQRAYQAAKDEIGGMVGGIGSTIKGAVAEPEDTKEHIAALAGPGGLIAYRASKAVVDAVENQYKAKKEDYRQAATDLANAVNEFHNKDYRGGIADAASTVAGVAGLSDPIMKIGRVRDIVQGTKPGGDIVTPVTKDVVDLGAMAALENAPKVVGDIAGALKKAPKVVGDIAGKATHIFDPATGSITPIEEATAKIASKSGISEGAAARTSEAVQAPLQTGIRNVLSDFSKDAGIAPPSTNSIRSVVEEAGDAVYAKSKQAYQTLDEASGGRWQRFDDSIKNISDKMDEVAGVDDDAFDKLAAKRTEVETAQQNLVDQLVKDGKIDPKLADQAKADYKMSQALYDLDKQVKASATGRAGIGNGVETVNPKSLSTRLNKLYDSGRLQEAVGEDRATQLLTHADTAQVSSELPSTGRKALQELLAGSTKQNRVFKGTTTDFGNVLDNFNKLTPEQRTAQFGSDAGKVRNFLKSQARRQFLNKVVVRGATGLGGAAGTFAVGKELYDTIHKVL
jgi:hypothetical protein